MATVDKDSATATSNANTNAHPAGVEKRAAPEVELTEQELWALARKVYELLRTELRLERERRG